MTSRPLPFRMAQCRHSSLEFFNDTYFEFLKSMGCGALYLQNSPFDPMRTGNVAQFFHHFHLISLFDIARSHRRREYQDHIGEICRRASGHGIEVWLDCWEPRLPAYAQGLIPRHWRGRGGWGWHGNKDIAFCWEEPEAVAFWKTMALDAIAALPGITGVIVSMMDNEASFCDADCPRCEGRSLHAGIQDVFATFQDIAANRPGGLQLAMYDWWLPGPLVDSILDRLPAGSPVIGRSARGLPFSSPDGSWSGHIADISNISDGLSEDFPRHCEKAGARNLLPIDMVSWSRGMENFFLPAPPDPLFAIRKSRALLEAGAHGWMDYDCGCIEPGSLAHGMREWTADPTASDETLFMRTLESIWGEQVAKEARSAYDLYREARQWMPTGIPSQETPNFDARGCGWGFCLFAPYHLSDLAFTDTVHAKNYFAPFNLIVGDTLDLLLHSTEQVCERLEQARGIVAGLPGLTPDAEWEVAVFEIHWRSFLSVRNYVLLAKAKHDHANKTLSDAEYRSRVSQIAQDELANLDGIEQWHALHPHQLGNPCHRALGHLVECFPEANFKSGLFIPKRKSLLFLRDTFDPAEFLPDFVIQETSTDDCPI